MMLMGKLEARARLTVVRKLCDHRSIKHSRAMSYLPRTLKMMGFPPEVHHLMLLWSVRNEP